MASGAPDYWSLQTPGRTVLRSGQARWEMVAEVEIPPGDTGIVPLYLVPSGKQLSITFVKGSMNKPGMAYGAFYRDDTNCGSFYIWAPFIFSTGETGAYTFTEGEIFGFRAINYSSYSINVSFKVAGTLSSV